MPKLLTSRGDYGLLLSVDLAKNWGEGPRSIADVARFYHLPSSFLEQIALELRKAHLLVSLRGKSGGYVLARRPALISVVEVLEALEGPLQIVTCQGGQCPVEGSCLTQDFWMALQRHLHGSLRKVTLEDLLKRSPHQVLADPFGFAQGRLEQGRDGERYVSRST